MKLLLFLLSITICIVTNAQIGINFKGVKNKKTYKFEINKPIEVLYVKNGMPQQIKGRLNVRDTTGIYILSRNKKYENGFIALDSIISVTKSFEKDIKPIGIFENITISVKKGWRFYIN